MIDFKNILYLQTGNVKQKNALHTLIELNLFSSLQRYTPILTGTIPIAIDIDDSDLDIICYSTDLVTLKNDIIKYYSTKKDFKIQEKEIRGRNTIVGRFICNNFTIEIFGQNRPVEQQEAYKHMIIEYKILQSKGSEFREQVIALKKLGYKTEPAFTKLLNIKGDPYSELLKYHI